MIPVLTQAALLILQNEVVLQSEYAAALLNNTAAISFIDRWVQE
jgi:hypothetical protein